MDKYNGTIYRPPVEAGTFLLPLTEGCTHNKCTFCSMYHGVKFRVLPLEELEDILTNARWGYRQYYDKIKRVSFVGGDPFALPAARLLERIELVRRHLPNAETFTMYARADNVARKSDAELAVLQQAGVDDLYLGIECGLDDVLDYMNKGYSTAEIRVQCARLSEVGIHYSDLLMLGCGGAGRGIECAHATAELVNATRPTQVLINTISAFEDTQLQADIESGAFVPATELECLQEERELLTLMEDEDLYFWANHPLDAVKIEGIVGKERDLMLADLDYGIAHYSDCKINRTARTGNL